MSIQLPTGVQLRRAVARDRPDVERLLESSALPSIDVVDQGVASFVAEAMSTAIGVIGLQRFGDDALLRGACVDLAWRRRGIGTNLVELALREAALGAVDSVYLVTGDSAPFFARFGFTKVLPNALPFAVTRAVARDVNARPDAITMALRLAPL